MAVSPPPLRCSDPTGVAVDAAGNLYIADSSNYRIRAVVASTGNIGTVAGNGTPGSSGDTGLATAAQLEPIAVAIETGGALYIADANNNRIRKVTGGIITTLAGNGTADYTGDNGPAISATLNDPEGVAVDGSGNVYIADHSNSVLRKVASGTITTVAGTGTNGFSGDNGSPTAAALSTPVGVAVDTAGNVYVADTGNARVRRIASNVIATVAGSGFSGGDGNAVGASALFGPSGVTIDSAGNVYIVDSDTGRVRIVTSGVIDAVAGNGTNSTFSGDNGPAIAASLYSPRDTAIDSAGNVYIADAYNNRVRKVSGGVITTIAGTGAQSFSGDNGPATAAALDTPQAVAVDAAGNVYIADYGNDRIRMVSASNGNISTIAGGGTPASPPGDGGSATGASLQSPTGVALDAAGNLYIADSGHHRVRKVTTPSNVGTSIITTVAGNGSPGFSGDGGAATAASLSSPQGLALDGAGNLYIADFGNVRVRKVRAGTGVINTIAGSGFQGFSGDGGPATQASFSSLSDVAVNAGGDVLIADYDNNRVRMVLKPTAKSDFNADDRTDVFWRHSDGINATWTMTGSGPAQFAAGFLPGVSPAQGWAPIATGDVNGDGIVDVIWFQQATGQIAIWLMNSPTSIGSATFPGSVGASSTWVLTAVGDVNGDGRADLVWRDSADGHLLVWSMSTSGTLAGTQDYGNVPASFELYGIGDFNGDGIGDLLWFEPADGVVAIWMMAGDGSFTASFPGAVGPGSSWRPYRIADLDGDGMSDIFWRDPSTGMAAAWYVDAGALADYDFFVSVQIADWTLGTAGDFDLDGRDDLMWYGPVNGSVVRWMMHGRHLAPTMETVSSVGTGWQMVP